MLQRHPDWFSLFKLPDSARMAAEPVIDRTFALSAGMMHRTDLDSLAAALLALQPKRIFEIGTYRGASAELMLSLLPEAQVVSIAYVRQMRKVKEFNNDELTPDEVGMLVSQANRPRFTQLLGDSHQIDPAAFVAVHGQMDFVFIDGDHSREGVRLDTELARAILAPDGAIGWHDANPKRRYLSSRLFLEEDLPELALATTDDFIGGIALWTERLDQQLRSGTQVAV